MSIVKRLTRRAAAADTNVRETIVNAIKHDLYEFEQAVEKVTNNRVTFYSAPEDAVAEAFDVQGRMSVIDKEYIRDYCPDMICNEVMDNAGKALEGHVAMMASDKYLLDIEETYDTIDALRAASIKALNPDEEDLSYINGETDLNELCVVLNECAMAKDLDLRYVCAENLHNFEDNVMDYARDSVYGDEYSYREKCEDDILDEFENSKDELYKEYGIDEDANYVVRDNDKYINCASKEELADEIINVIGDQLFDLLAELQNAA